MLKSSYQTVATEGSTVNTGNDSVVSTNISTDKNAEKFLNEISKQRVLTTKAQEQMDRLLAMLEEKERLIGVLINKK